MSHGLGVGQVGIEMHGRTGTDRRHSQLLDVKLQRQLAPPQSVDDQLCLVADQPIDDDLYLAVLGRQGLHLAAMFSGRQIQLQSCYIHRVDVQGRAKELPDTHMKAEFRNIHDGLKSRFVIVGVGFPENSESGAFNLESLDQRDVKGVKFHPALEPGRQRLNHRRAQAGLGAMDGHAQYDAQYDNCCSQQQRQSADPAPAAGSFPRWNDVLCALCHFHSLHSRL